MKGGGAETISDEFRSGGTIYFLSIFEYTHKVLPLDPPAALSYPLKRCEQDNQS